MFTVRPSTYSANTTVQVRVTVDPIGRIGLGWSLVAVTVGLGTEMREREGWREREREREGDTCTVRL